MTIKPIIKILAFSLLLASSTVCNAQQTEHTTEPENAIAFSPGVILQGNVFADVNLLIGKTIIELDSKIPIVGIKGFRVGFESNFRDGDNYVIAPKIGYELSPMIYTLRLSAVNYFQNGSSEFRILPEVGLSLGGWVNITYGYGISFNDENLNKVSNHRVALSFNLNNKLRKATLSLIRN